MNTYDPDAAAAYERYAVPDTGQVIFEAAFANFHLHPATEVHFKNEHRAPLLIVEAEKDHTAPASVARAQYGKYEHSPAKTDHPEFEGGPHLSMVGEGWEEIAAAIDSWLMASSTPTDRLQPRPGNGPTMLTTRIPLRGPWRAILTLTLSGQSGSQPFGAGALFSSTSNDKISLAVPTGPLRRWCA